MTTALPEHCLAYEHCDCELYAGTWPAQADVTRFHVATGLPAPGVPTKPDEASRLLRGRLLYEEFMETIDALALEIDSRGCECCEGFPEVIAKNWEPDQVALADGLADLIYVALGTAVAYGIDLSPVWREVQRSNMAKVDPETGTVRRREDGKILKPESWEPPDIASVIEPW